MVVAGRSAYKGSGKNSEWEGDLCFPFALACGEVRVGRALEEGPAIAWI